MPFAWFISSLVGLNMYVDTKVIMAKFAKIAVIIAKVIFESNTEIVIFQK